MLKSAVERLTTLNHSTNSQYHAEHGLSVSSLVRLVVC